MGTPWSFTSEGRDTLSFHLRRVKKLLLDILLFPESVVMRLSANRFRFYALVEKPDFGGFSGAGIKMTRPLFN